MLSHRDPSLSVSSMGYIVSSQSVRATEVIGVLGMDRTACCMDPHFMMESVSIIYPCYDKGLLPQGVLFVYFDVIPEIPSSMFCAFLKFIFEILVWPFKLYISSFISVCVFLSNSLSSCMSWSFSSCYSTACYLLKYFMKWVFHILFRILHQGHIIYFWCYCPWFSCIAFSGSVGAWLLGSGGDILSWLFMIIFLCWCLWLG